MGWLVAVAALAGFAQGSPQPDMTLRCVPADQTHAYRFAVEIYLDGASDSVVRDADIIVQPVSGFDDMAAFRLNEVQLMRVAGAIVPDDRVLVRVGSGMWGETPPSRWRIAVSWMLRQTTAGQSEVDDANPILAILTDRNLGPTAQQYVANCEQVR